MPNYQAGGHADPRYQHLDEERDASIHQTQRVGRIKLSADDHHLWLILRESSLQKVCIGRQRFLYCWLYKWWKPNCNQSQNSDFSTQIKYTGFQEEVKEIILHLQNNTSTWTLCLSTCNCTGVTYNRIFHGTFLSLERIYSKIRLNICKFQNKTGKTGISWSWWWKGRKSDTGDILTFWIKIFIFYPWNTHSLLKCVSNMYY